MEANGSLDKYKRVLLTLDEGIKLLLEGKSIDGALFNEYEDIELYSKHAEQVLGVPSTINFDKELELTIDEFHEQKTSQWRVPEKYKKIDIISLLLDRCTTDDQRARVNEEYALFQEKELIPLLQFLLFLVDYLRANKYVWGVGRGSSVSSYVLFLIGVHKIDSLAYGLDIKEFLK